MKRRIENEQKKKKRKRGGRRRGEAQSHIHPNALKKMGRKNRGP